MNFPTFSLKLPFMTLKERIQVLFLEVFESKTFDLTVLQKHFSPQYQQHVDGQVLDFEKFAAHIKALKEAALSLLNFTLSTFSRKATAFRPCTT